jgi:uncharacterized protein YdhG (YjbR/CyaY superfamily)
VQGGSDAGERREVPAGTDRRNGQRFLTGHEKKHMTNKKQFTTIDEYIKTCPEDVQSILERIRQTIRKAAPEAAETISYGMPTFNLDGKYLVSFAAWKKHIALYPIPSGTEAFRKELSHYKRTKGSVHFPFDQPIPYDFVAKIVRFRMKPFPIQG